MISGRFRPRWTAFSISPLLKTLLLITALATSCLPGFARKALQVTTIHPPPQGYTIYVAPHSHIDLVWYWSYDKTQVLSIKILRQALNMLKSDPRYRFTQDQFLALKPFWDSLSEADRAFARQMIKEGRLEIATGMYVQPEIAEPDFESLTREFLPAMPWMKEVLGANVLTAWNIDTYGQTVQMPQLFSKAGLKYFVFMRDVPENLTASIKSPFYWQSPDGSKVLSYWLAGGYDVRWKGVGRDLKQFIDHNVEGNRDILFPWGGDLAFPNQSTEEIERIIRAAAEEQHIPVKAVVFCTPRQYFEDVEKNGVALPTYKYDFNPPQHIQDLRGLYGERPLAKLANRRSEEMLESAEKFNVVASTFGQVYPLVRFNTAWQNVLFNQDHDAIPGSHIDDVDDEIMSRYGGALEAGRDSMAESLYTISRQVKTTGSGDYPFLVFNPLSFARTEMVRYSPLFKEKLTNFRIVDEGGKPVPFRAVDISSTKPGKHLSMGVVEFEAKDIPALGYRLYRIEPIAGVAHQATWGTAKREISNQYYVLRIDPASGCISSLKDRRSGRELLDTTKYLGNELVLEEEQEPDLEGMVHFTGKEVRANQFPAASIVEIDDDLGTTIRSEGPFLGGRRRQEITVYRSIPRIDFKTQLIGFPGHDGMLGAIFPLRGGKDVTLDYETHNAVTRRPDGIFESQTWMDAGFDSFGLGIINRGMAGFHTDRDVIRLMLLRSVTNYQGYAAPAASEAGSHTFEYSIYPHAGTWNSSNLVAQAHSFNSPVRTIATDEHDGSLPSSHSFLSVEGNFEITALKQAENGDGFILRGHETQGKEGPVKLTFALPLEAASSTDLLEHAEKTLEIHGDSVELNCHPFEFVTIELHFKQERPQTVSQP